MARYTHYVFGTVLFGLVGFLFGRLVGTTFMGLDAAGALVPAIACGLVSGLSALYVEYRHRRRLPWRGQQEIFCADHPAENEWPVG